MSKRNILSFAGTTAVLVMGLVVASWFFLRSSFTSEGWVRAQRALGMDAPAPERHVIPSDFQGWLELRWGLDGQPALGSEGGVRIVEYTASGRLDTSTPAPSDDAFFHRSYYQSTADGLVPLSRADRIWGEYRLIVTVDDQDGEFGFVTGCFVGTFGEFRKTPRPHPDLILPDLPMGAGSAFPSS